MNSLVNDIWKESEMFLQQVIFRVFSAVLAISISVSGLSWASEDPVSRKELNHRGSFRLSYFDSSRDLDDRYNFYGIGLEQKISLRITPNFSSYSEIRFFNHNLLSWEDVQSEIREGYLNIHLENFDIQLGKQIISWGRADRINPTDNLTPYNYTLLFPEDSDLKSGIIALKTDYYFKNMIITGIWIPFFEPNTIPLPKIPGILIVQQNPSHSLNNSEYAVKMNIKGETIEWSFSYFNGFDLLPDFRLFNINPFLITLALKYPQIQVIGADFATAIGKFGLRGEIAYFFTEDSKGNNPEKKNPYLLYVLGIERTFLEYLNVNFQFIQKIVSHFEEQEEIIDPITKTVVLEGATWNNQLDKITNQCSLRVGYKCFYETLETEVSTLYNITRKDYLIRPKIIYAISDGWKITIGSDIFHGQEESFYGRLKKNKTFYSELKTNF